MTLPGLAWFFSGYEVSNRGQWACALRAPPNHAPGLLIPQVGACTNLNAHVPTAFNLAPLDRALAAVYVRCAAQQAPSALLLPSSRNHTTVSSRGGRLRKGRHPILTFSNKVEAHWLPLRRRHPRLPCAITQPSVAERLLKRRDSSSCKGMLNSLSGLGFSTHGTTLFEKEPYLLLVAGLSRWFRSFDSLYYSRQLFRKNIG